MTPATSASVSTSPFLMPFSATSRNASADIRT